MPPAHGALLAGRVLSDPNLRASWESELAAICLRMNTLRNTFSERLTARTGRDFGFISRENGMFSFLGLTVEQAQAVRASKRAIYARLISD